jgi:glycosyltransferase involved in cell wall biosynthesis
MTSSDNNAFRTPSTEHVTVFIPTFNRLTLLRRAVASALQQGAAVRVHVLDNASIDGTAQWLADTAATEPRLSFTARSGNVGALRNFEEGFNGVQTPYLIPLADDDELVPGFVQRALVVVEEDPSLAAVIGQSVVMEHGRELYRFPARATWGRLSAPEHLREWLMAGHYITWSAILWSTSAVRTVGVVADLGGVGLPSDVWFQARIFAEHAVYVLDMPAATFVRHGDQASGGLKFTPEIVRDFSRLHRRIDALLRERALYTTAEQKRLMAGFVNRTCICACDWLSRSPPHHEPKVAINERCLSLAHYERGFAPFCGWRPCPVLPHRAHSLRDGWFRARCLAAWISQRFRYARLTAEQDSDAGAAEPGPSR